jgi:hypothetical protein
LTSSNKFLVAQIYPPSVFFTYKTLKSYFDFDNCVKSYYFARPF